MQKIKEYRAAIKISGIMVALMLLGAGCAAAPETTDGSGVRDKDEENKPVYYDFEDVLVPRDLKLNAKSSFVYRASDMTAGVLVFTASVERNSLIQFFKNNMAKDNWQMVGSFKSPRTLLLFQKENRWCVIKITDKNWDTLVEIWAAPSSGHLGSGLLK